MNKGTYALIIQLKNKATLEVGKLGVFYFPSGYYMYFGSALGGLEARIERHLRRDKRLHWHIDYLLQSSEIVEVWHIISDQRLECMLCNEARQTSAIADIVAGFGSSDCHCISHLLYCVIKPSFQNLNTKLRERGLMLKKWNAT